MPTGKTQNQIQVNNEGGGGQLCCHQPQVNHASQARFPGVFCLEKKMIDQKTKDRFFEKVIPEPNSGCWLWIGAWHGDGYGIVKIRQVNFRTHRVSWELHNGPIPDGLCVLHKCDTPCCVNPNHLFLGTQPDNVQDCLNKNRHTQQIKRRGDGR